MSKFFNPALKLSLDSDKASDKDLMGSIKKGSDKCLNKGIKKGIFSFDRIKELESLCKRLSTE